MRNRKDVKLLNIYIRIHNGQVITIDDLAYLAKYNPVCFKLTCDNLLYKMPEAKELVKPAEEKKETDVKKDAAKVSGNNPSKKTADEMIHNEKTIQQFIENLKEIESEGADAVQSVDIIQVKELLGDLFMEHLFPHNGFRGYFDAMDGESISKFNVKV